MFPLPESHNSHPVWLTARIHLPAVAPDAASQAARQRLIARLDHFRVSTGSDTVRCSLVHFDGAETLTLRFLTEESVVAEPVAERQSSNAADTMRRADAANDEKKMDLAERITRLRTEVEQEQEEKESTVMAEFRVNYNMNGSAPKQVVCLRHADSADTLAQTILDETRPGPLFLVRTLQDKQPVILSVEAIQSIEILPSGRHTPAPERFVARPKPS